VNLALRTAVKTNAAARPGVYRMIDDEGEVLYVGKSNEVRGRLLYYFRPQGRGNGKRVLADTHRIEVEYAPSERAALRRERRLIKRHRPPFNVVDKPKLTVSRAYNRTRPLVRVATVTVGAVGAVRLNQRVPGGVNLGVARVPAGAVAAVASFGGALVAKKAGYPRIASSLVDLGVGGAIGTVYDAATGGQPLLAVNG
jgi:hypothetical protein